MAPNEATLHVSEPGLITPPDVLLPPGHSHLSLFDQTLQVVSAALVKYYFIFKKKRCLRKFKFFLLECAETDQMATCDGVSSVNVYMPQVVCLYVYLSSAPLLLSDRCCNHAVRSLSCFMYF